MDDLFASGRIVDLILALVVLEGLLLLALRRMHGIPMLPLMGNLLAGGCLLLALRGALVDAAWPWIALALFGALLAHLVDLGGRWRIRQRFTAAESSRQL